MISAIIQARVGSTRLPNKVFAEIEGKPLLWHVVNRLKKSKYLDSIIIATSTNAKDEKIENWARANNILCHRGSEDNVLKRYYDTAKKYNIDVIVRITADDPFKDYQVMDQVIKKFLSEEADFACNNKPPTFPEGLDIEVFSKNAITKAYNNAKSAFEKEHVTQYFYKNPDDFNIISVLHTDDLSYLRWTIDEDKDLEMVRKVYKKLFTGKHIFLMKDILELLEKHTEIPHINDTVNRSTMYK
jgi:spore coat polysaccharide biosynthesis protein SpsF